MTRLLADPQIILNRRKIKATIDNARTFLELADAHGSYLRGFNALRARTPREVRALYDRLGSTFRFMGPATTRCYLMGVGQIPAAHDRHCRRFAPHRAAGTRARRTDA